MSKSTPPCTYEELERSLPYLVNRLAMLGQATQRRMLQKNNLNLVTLRTMSILQIEDGLTINEISARTFTEQSSISRAVDAMVIQGLVERRVPQHDQRRREVMLTDKGRDQLFENWPAMDEYFTTLSEGIAEAERQVCRDVLNRMLANLIELNG